MKTIFLGSKVAHRYVRTVPPRMFGEIESAGRRLGPAKGAGCRHGCAGGNTSSGKAVEAASAAPVPQPGSHSQMFYFFIFFFFEA